MNLPNVMLVAKKTPVTRDVVHYHYNPGTKKWDVTYKNGNTFHYTDAAMGGEAIDKYGDPLPQHELDKCLAADSVLLGAVGGPKWEGLPGD